MTISDARNTLGHVVGTWDIDVAHSHVSFSVRHMMLSKTRGQFRNFAGVIVTVPTMTGTVVTATVDVASLDTNSEPRDNHLRSDEFFDVATYPAMSFVSTAVDFDGSVCVMTGDLTVKGISGQIAFDVDVHGIGPDAFGGTRAGFTGHAVISRKAFGVDVNVLMPNGGGVVIGDKISLLLEIEAVLRTD